MRKVLFGTPCYDGKVHAEFLQSLLGTLRLADKNTQIFPIQVCYDALVQRARNDLVRMAIESNCDDLIFMDADQEWNPEWVFTLLNHKADVVGCPVPKKSDILIDFNIKLLEDGVVPPLVNKLMEVSSVGTGFLKISKSALKQVWDISPEYNNGELKGRMVFDVQLQNGELISEDNVFCAKWKSLGGKIWVDPSMSCRHIGIKKYNYEFSKFIDVYKLRAKTV